MDISIFDEFSTGEVSIETELLQSEINLDFLKNSIICQIENISESPKIDYFSIVKTKFLKIKEIVEDKDVLQEVMIEMFDFCVELIDKIDERYNLCLNYDKYSGSLFVVDLLEDLYNFFILNKLENIKDFFINYISANRTEIIKELDLNYKRKDVTTLRYKKDFKDDKELVAILGNVTTIMKFIIETLNDDEEFLNYIDMTNYNNHRIMEYRGDVINGFFSIKLIEDFIDKDFMGSHGAYEISTIIRNYFIDEGIRNKENNEDEQLY